MHLELYIIKITIIEMVDKFMNGSCNIKDISK